MIVVMATSELTHLEGRLHELERQVLKEQRFMHDFIERANLMVIGLDRDGRVTIFNRKAEETTGYSKEETLGAALDELFRPEVGNTVHGLLNQLRIAGGGGFRCETTLVTKTGRPKSVTWNASVLTDGDQTIGLMAFGEDQTGLEREQHRARWFDGMTLLQQVVSKFAHDFNNLLGPMLGYASMLRASAVGEMSQAQYAEKIEASVKRCTAALERLLQFGHGGVPKPERFDLGEAVSRVIERLRAGAPSGVAIAQAPADRPIHVAADAAQFEQVLSEVLRNAFDAMPDGGHVEVATAAVEADADFCRERPGLEPGWYAAVRVTDDGPGILPEDALRLIEPFQSSKQERCAGLGLSVAYGLVRKNGGWIELARDSRAGSGTTVTIHLPLDASSERARVEPIGGARKGPRTILLVDDERALVDTVSDMLKHLGYLVLTANDGQEAVQIYEEHRANVDLIILDMVMPHKGGREAYEDLKRIQPDVKVLLTSGFDQQKAVAEGMCGEGAAGFVPKPFTLSDLSSVVRRIIERQA
jgi:two-component system cell cycle sensor histidine kinase/response regulator CckA